MALSMEKYFVMSNGLIEKTSRESWLDILHRWLVRCPHCAAVWLAIGIRENERYVCKDCGHDFAVKNSVNHTDRFAADRGQ